MTKEIPRELLKNLSNYGPQIYDSECGEPIGWGYKILVYLGEDKFRKLGRYGEMRCIYSTWFLITKNLIREEAEEKYGEITDEEFGLRGGWKSITFGKKKFCSKYLKD